MRIRLWVLGIVATVTLPGCGVFPLDECTTELAWSVTPEVLELRVGERARVSAEGLSCGGRKSVDVSMRWTVTDSTVAAVESGSGTVAGIAVGATTVEGIDEGPYGSAPVSNPVVVTR